MQTNSIKQDSPAVNPVTNIQSLWTQKQLAGYLGKSTAWCERARWEGKGPKYVKLGRNVRYRYDDVIEWINSSVMQSTSDSLRGCK